MSHPTVLTTIIFILLCLVACGKNDTSPASDANLQVRFLEPSVDTCSQLSNLNQSSWPVEITGYANESILIEGMSVYHMYFDGRKVQADTKELSVGTYCSLNINSGKLTSITMAAHPGCFVGWQVCQ